ncbi:MAG: hypothetical protein ABIQ95_12985 [Bdellovibrionia bacterium]
MPRMLRCTNTIIVSLVIILISNLAVAGGRSKPDLIVENFSLTDDPLPETPPQFPVSQIHFGKSGSAYPQFASIATADPLKKCPLESFPADLASIVDQLTLKVRNSVAKIKATRGGHCTALADKLSTDQAQLSAALKSQLAAGNAAPSSGTPAAAPIPSSQDLINAQTKNAGATSQLILTVSDLVQKDCLSSIDDRIIIQRLVGQIVTLGGLFWGGLPGIMAAVGGQLIGNLPIFKDELDTVLKLFRQYDEKTERGAFLCLYRQMQKTSCSLFSKPEDQIIEGFDLTLGSGPALTTTNSIEEIKSKTPADFHDVVMLHEIHQNFANFLSLMEKEDSLKNGSPEAVQELRQVCTYHQPEAFQNVAAHPPHLTNSLNSLITTCEKLRTFQWTVPTSSDFVLEQGDIFWNVLAVSNYYEQIRKSDTELAKILQTYESLIYFQNLKKNFEEFRDPTTGSQTRLNYLRLTKKLGGTIATKSFRKIMKANWRKLKEHSIFRRNQVPALALRQRALTAMLDLCQTLDPTLACLHVSDPSHTRLHKRWMKRCVGPKSRLCHDTVGLNENGVPLRDILLTDPAYRAYFDSLCGVAP